MGGGFERQAQVACSPQPGASALQSALTYPSRRVRLESALALAASRPGSGFNGDDLVVQTLASAVRTDAASGSCGTVHVSA